MEMKKESMLVRNSWCIVKECNKIAIQEKKYFFRFPKEHDRWLKWIEACGRFDLKKMGAEYAYKVYKMCHLHFEKKWYKIGKKRSYLHPDAIPTIFYGKNNSQTEIVSVDETVEKKEEDTKKIEENLKTENITEVSMPNISVLVDRQKRLNRCDKMNYNYIIVTTPIQMSQLDNKNTMQSVQVQNMRQIKKLQQRLVKYRKQILKLRARNRRLLVRMEKIKSKVAERQESSDVCLNRHRGPRASFNSDHTYARLISHRTNLVNYNSTVTINKNGETLV
ncbi:52 kDa repressor of the inhibitor of the protein kinase-like [Harpegnathos saltator]|uniref:52 kDa repressor of the inhibitor of the protein kinase-like n=1 Tax=Harpegnathos saltator TaxID=610380 RepID=UPI00058E45EF|nr:52 kDa repressor of the inhibitor of the protein kinase-like [Harpegnathos saltator]